MPLAAVALWFFADRGPDSDQESACHCTSAASESEARPQLERPAAGQRAGSLARPGCPPRRVTLSHESVALARRRRVLFGPFASLRPSGRTGTAGPGSAAGRRRELDCEGPAPGLKVTVQAQALGRPGDSVTSSRRGPEPPARLGGPAAAAELEA